MNIADITNEFSAYFKKEKQSKITSVINDIISRYGESHRAYHNISHVFFILEERNKLPLDKAQKELLFLVALFHDFIYEIGSTNNERKSAEAAATFLHQLNYDETKIEWIYNSILLTKDHNCSQADDLQKLFCDLDLLILASPKLTYQIYIQQIRKEYGVYPNFIYNNGRKNVLKSFLKRDKIFQSNFFKHMEDQAQVNINHELKSL